MGEVSSPQGPRWTGATIPPTADATGQRSEDVFDPLRYCIFTTIALLAWVAGPPVVVAVMAGLGLWAYGRAWRGGRRRSRCLLGDVRLVLAYLFVAFAAGATVTVLRVADLAG
jgi:hypothetical protein